MSIVAVAFRPYGQDFASKDICLVNHGDFRGFGVVRFRSDEETYHLLPLQPSWSGICIRIASHEDDREFGVEGLRSDDWTHSLLSLFCLLRTYGQNFASEEVCQSVLASYLYLYDCHTFFMTFYQFIQDGKRLQQKRINGKASSNFNLNCLRVGYYTSNASCYSTNEALVKHHSDITVPEEIILSLNISLPIHIGRRRSQIPREMVQTVTVTARPCYEQRLLRMFGFYLARIW